MSEIKMEMLYSRETEDAVLSACVNYGNKALEEAVEMFRAEWFFDPVNVTALRVLQGMWSRREPLDLLTYTEAWRKEPDFEKIDRCAALLTERHYTTLGSAGNFSYYAATLRDYWLRREMVRVAASLREQAQDIARAPQETLDESEAALLALRTEEKRQGLQHCADAVDAAAKRIELAHKKRGGVVGLATGFADLDRMTGGLKGGQLIVIAARPSMGKSALATNIAEHVCLKLQEPVALFSLEMTGEELMERVLCGQAGIELQRVRDGFMSKVEAERLGRTAMDVASAPLYLDETPALTIATFRARARRAVAKHGVKLIMVDYLQLMKGSTKRAQQDRRLEIDEISSGLKATAKELHVPVIALSQLNRDAEEMASPKLSHLRESGSIEQDADMVALLHRPERVTADPKRKEELKGQATLNLAKQRNGPVGIIELHFDGELTRFRSVTEKIYSNKKEERQRRGAGAAE
jgi:replicative DNA helicase